MVNLVRKVEELLPKFFNCERATLVLIHRFKRFQFRIKQLENSNDYNYEQYDLQQGLSGYVAISTNTLVTDDANSDGRFCPPLDDPNYIEKDPNQSLPRQILTVPVFTNHDME